MQQEQPLAPTAHAAEPLQAEPVAHHSSLGNGGVETSHTAARDPIPQTMAPKEAKSLHKHLEKEASREDDHIKSQVKEIGKAEKAERKAEKADSKALKAQTKAEEKMHSANKELERAQAKHDQAAREAQAKAKEVEIKKQHHAQVTNNLQNAKHQLDDLTKTREAHSTERQGKLAELDQIINAAKS